jgi:NADPH:quinone reductase-like Zn-dependent oxidoreductase
MQIGNKMKAAIRTQYGSQKVLNIKEVETPTPRDKEILIRVYAATVNRTDCAILWGKPFLMRFFTGLFKPKLKITGTDFAGKIEAIGKNVSNFKVGDRVWGFKGFGIGSHAPYISISEDSPIIFIPDKITYDQAAACAEGAYYALDAVNMVNPKTGQKALVNGATGAIGSAMVQFLKFYGVYLTAVCSGDNSELVKSLGADKIINFNADDFTKDIEKYDFVFDAVAKSTFDKCKPLLKEKGIYTSSEPNLFQVLITTILGGKKVMFRPPKNIKAGLTFIKELLENGNFRPVIDRKYPIDKIAEAYKYVASGEKIGNVIITMDA